MAGAWSNINKQPKQGFVDMASRAHHSLLVETDDGDFFVVELYNRRRL